jgi:hypothetical protein
LAAAGRICRTTKSGTGTNETDAKEFKQFPATTAGTRQTNGAGANSAQTEERTEQVAGFLAVVQFGVVSVYKESEECLQMMRRVIYFPYNISLSLSLSLNCPDLFIQPSLANPRR